MPIVLAIIGLVFLYDLLWWRAADRGLRALPGSARWRVPLGAFMAAQAACVLWIVAGRAVVRDADAAMPPWLLTATFVWHLLVLPVTLGAWLLWAGGRGAMALVRVATGVPRRRPREAAAPPAGIPGAAAPAGPTRRQLLGAAVAAAPPMVTAIGSAAASAQLDEFRVRRLTLDLPHLPPSLDGTTIAHVSDIHVGRFTNGGTLRRIVGVTNDLRADLILLTGDLINMSIGDLPSALDAVKRMDARSGVYMVEGNHDLIDDPHEFRRVAKASGVPFLLNESARVRVRGADVQLLGLRWGTGTPGAGRGANRGDRAVAASLSELMLRSLPAAAAFPILLAHHPHALDYAAKMGIPLTLSGHTHGGQLMLAPGVGFGPWMYRYWSGAYRKGNAWGVVSNGVGNWFPLRVGAPAEIIHITLRRS